MSHDRAEEQVKSPQTLWWLRARCQNTCKGTRKHPENRWREWPKKKRIEQRSGTAMRPRKARAVEADLNMFRHPEVQGWWKARERARLTLDEVPGIWPNTRMQADGFLVQKGIWKSFYLKITFGQVSWGWKGGHSTVSFVYKACWWWFSQSVLWYYMISQIFTRSHRKVTKDKLYLGRFLLGSVAFPNEIEAQSSCDLEVIDPFHTAFSRYIDSSRRLFVKSICCCTDTPEWTLVPPFEQSPYSPASRRNIKEDLRCVCPTVERVLVAGFLTSSSLLQWLFMGFLLGRLGLKRYSFRHYLKLSLQRLRLGLRGLASNSTWAFCIFPTSICGVLVLGIKSWLSDSALGQSPQPSARRNVISWYDLVLRRRPCVVGLEWRSLQRWSWRSHELLQEAILFLNLNTTCCEIKPYLSCVHHAKQSQNSQEPKIEPAVKLHKEVGWTRHMLYPPCQVGATTRSTRSIWGSAGTGFHTSLEWTVSCRKVRTLEALCLARRGSRTLIKCWDGKTWRRQAQLEAV